MADLKYTLLKNVKLLDSGNTPTAVKDILFKNRTKTEDSVILKVEASPSLPSDGGCMTIDARGNLVLPGFIDIHCHLRDPGFEYKEDIVTGTAAAAAGGYSTVVCMPNTKPVIDKPEVIAYINDKAKRLGHCRVLVSAAITEGQNGLKTVDFDKLHRAGAVAFTDDGKPVSDDAVMLEAMKKCAEKDYLIISHCEINSIARGGVINEGKISRMLGVKGIPNSAEALMIARDIVLAEETGCRLHIAHVSTRSGLQLIREAKARGVRVTCETCPHYFSLCDNDVMLYGSNAKMNPPLRSADDVKAVIEAIIDGTIDCISTDHAPHSEKEKKGELSATPNGIIGLQTAFAVGVTYLVMPGHITMSRLSELMTEGPARILGIDCGIKPGARADIAIVSPKKEFVFLKNMIKSKSANTPFAGLPLKGYNEGTFVNGELFN